MGMHDNFKPKNDFRCPVCNDELEVWQSKDLNCLLHIWTEGVMHPTGSSAAEVVSVGGISLFNIEASISTGMEGDVVLLGMSFLKNLGVVQKNGKMILTKKSLIKEPST